MELNTLLSLDDDELESFIDKNGKIKLVLIFIFKEDFDHEL